MNISNQCFGKSISTYFLVIIFKRITFSLTAEDVLDMKKLWVNWFLLFISMATAEKLSHTIDRLTDNELNCTTRECVKDNLEFELTMLNNINPSVDPCDNFYEFACGNFDNVPDDIVQIRQHKRFHFAFEDMLHKMFYKISESNSSDSFKPFNFLRDFLISCDRLNKNNNASHPGIKEDKLEYLKEIISKLGKWPVLEGHKWNKTDDNWTKFMDEAKNVHYLNFHFYGLRSRSIRNRTIIFFDPGNLEFPYEKIRNRQFNRTINAYHNFMVNVANLLGANKTQAEIELAESLEFELKLAYISTENIASTSSNKYNSIELSVKEIIEIWPSIDWVKLFNTESDLPSNITNETQVFIKNYVDVTNLEELVNNTPARVRANYAMWKTIQNLIPMIKSASLARVMQAYNKIKNPSHLDEPVKCIEMLQTYFPELMIAHYVRNYPVDKLVKTHVHQLISYVEQKFIDTLNGSKWLDLKTRDTLFETINFLKFIIGYSDEIMDDKKLIEYFQGLNITQDNFLKNVLNRKLFVDKKLFSLSHKPKNSIGFAENFYVLTTLTADAFFHDYTKTIGVELLRNLFFSIHRTNYVNLAVLGSKLAHEIGHSIDRSYHNKFRVKDSKWSESSKQKYHDIRECITQQYSNYSSKVTGRKVDGGFYVKENIADNIGVQVAYSAYQDWAKTHGPEPTFSSLPYNSNQLFWLSFANQWCWPKSTLQNWRSTDEHPSSAHRVVIPLFNSPEFSTDFNCPSGSNMNPVKKCIVF